MQRLVTHGGFDLRPDDVRERLDETTCEYMFAPLDGQATQEVALDSGLALGFYINTHTCAECTAGQPIRLESFSLRVRRPDGSVADTLDLVVSVYCLSTNQEACAGAGTLRNIASHSISFDADSVDGIDEIQVIAPQLSVVADEGEAFAVIEAQGCGTVALPHSWG
ncbi:MAG: hypothetical protein IPG71_07215 [bacterium]|nr:hypothetical protein [bacterium]